MTQTDLLRLFNIEHHAGYVDDTEDLASLYHATNLSLFACFYCGRQLKKRMGMADHIYPRCRGGHATVPSCGTCNQRKADLTLSEYRELVYPGRQVEFHGEMLLRQYMELSGFAASDGINSVVIR